MDKQDKAFLGVFAAVLGALVMISVIIFVLAHLVSPDDSAGLAELRLAQAEARLQPVGRVVVAGTPEAEQEAATLGAGQQVASAETAALSGEQVYQQVCAACHDAGVMDSPILGDADVWAARYEEKGLDELVHNAIVGINNMPARGGNASLSDENIYDSVVYILQNSGIEVAGAEPSVTEPALEAAPEAPAAEQTVTEAAPAVDAEPAVVVVEPPAAEPTPTEVPAAGTPAAGTPAAGTPEVAVVVSEEPTAGPAPAEPPVADGAEVTVVTTEAPVVEAPPAEEASPPAEPTAAGFVLPADLDLAEGEQIYAQVCALCHAQGVAGSPKLDDAAAWAPRLAQGYDTLIEHVLKGYKGMPPKGGRPDIADEKIINATGYMLNMIQ